MIDTQSLFGVIVKVAALTAEQHHIIAIGFSVRACIACAEVSADE